MGGLQRFEQKLESLISGTFAKAFRSSLQPVEISAQLQREVDNKAQILSRNRRLVPNEFTISLSEGDVANLSLREQGMTATLAQELIDQLRAYADQQGYVFPGPISISFEPDDELPTGRCLIASQSQAAVSSEGETWASRRSRAVLEINGTRHPLQPPGLVVGRGSEADVRITDPGVSRRHVDFEVNHVGERGIEVRVVDLGSTNGMLVNGRKTPQADLRDGSVVRIGHTDMIVRVVEDHV